jgi:hypothetical protein
MYRIRTFTLTLDLRYHISVSLGLPRLTIASLIGTIGSQRYLLLQRNDIVSDYAQGHGGKSIQTQTEFPFGEFKLGPH